MLDKKKIVNRMINLDSHLKIINLYPLLNNKDSFLIEGIEVGEKKFDFCKKDTDVVIKCDDGRLFRSSVNFMELYNNEGRPLTEVTFGYDVPGGTIKFRSRLHNRYMTFGYYPDDVLDQAELLKHGYLEVKRQNDEHIDYKEYMLSGKEINAICTSVKNRAFFANCIDGNKRPEQPNRGVKTLEKKQNVC